MRGLDTIGIRAHFHWKTDRTPNTEFIEEFRSFLTRGRTQGFDFGPKCYDRLKLIELTRYDFSFRIDFKFLSVLNICWIK
jgi:hypothetical protein